METRNGDLYGGAGKKLGFGPGVCCWKMIIWEGVCPKRRGGGVTILE